MILFWVAGFMFTLGFFDEFQNYKWYDYVLLFVYWPYLLGKHYHV